jgi:hypothetical protein
MIVSIREFFHKIHKLLEIVNYPIEYCFKINKIEAQFNVTSIIFQKFEIIFTQLFKTQSFKQENLLKQLKSFDLFKFTWLIFLYVKGIICQALSIPYKNTHFKSHLRTISTSEWRSC